jgi:hypothetical protein
MCGFVIIAWKGEKSKPDVNTPYLPPENQHPESLCPPGALIFAEKWE